MFYGISKPVRNADLYAVLRGRGVHMCIRLWTQKNAQGQRWPAALLLQWPCLCTIPECETPGTTQCKRAIAALCVHRAPHHLHFHAFYSLHDFSPDTKHENQRCGGPTGALNAVADTKPTISPKWVVLMSHSVYLVSRLFCIVVLV